MHARLERFLKLSNVERRALITALFWLPFSAGGLRIVGYRRWHAWLTSDLPSPAGPGMTGVALNKESQDSVRLAARMVQAAAREGLWSGTCLERSLVLWWMIRRQGLQAELKIGARKNEGSFEAHAWVEVDDVALNDSEQLHRHYEPFEASSPLSTHP